MASVRQLSALIKFDQIIPGILKRLFLVACLDGQAGKTEVGSQKKRYVDHPLRSCLH